MGRLTTDIKVDAMSMCELAHNSCYSREGKARYRDYDTDIDAREFAKSLMVGYGHWKIDGLDTDNEIVDDDIFDESITENLMYEPDSTIGLIALFYRNLWAMADLREKLKAYEEIIDSPEKLKLIDALYLEKCEEINRLNAELAEYRELKEDGLIFEMPVGIGDLVYVISKCEVIPPQLDGTLYGENGELGTATGYYCPYENNCPHECEECDDVLECDKLKTIEAIFEDEVESIYIDETGLNVSTANCRACGEIGRIVFLTKEEAEQALERMKEVQE